MRAVNEFATLEDRAEPEIEPGKRSHQIVLNGINKSGYSIRGYGQIRSLRVLVAIQLVKHRCRLDGSSGDDPDTQGDLFSKSVANTNILPLERRGLCPGGLYKAEKETENGERDKNSAHLFPSQE